MKLLFQALADATRTRSDGGGRARGRRASRAPTARQADEAHGDKENVAFAATAAAAPGGKAAAATPPVAPPATMLR